VHTSAALKIGVRYDLCRGHLVGPLLFDGRTHESTTPIQRAPLPAQALRLADLGFFALDVFADLSAADGYWLARLHRTTAVYDAAGRRWDRRRDRTCRHARGAGPMMRGCDVCGEGLERRH